MTRSGAHRDDLGIVGRLEHPGDEHVLSMPLRTPALKGSDLSGPFRHRQLQLLLARDMQHAVIVLDHIANGLQVALDQATTSPSKRLSSPCLTTRCPTMNFSRIRSSLMSPPPQSVRLIVGTAPI